MKKENRKNVVAIVVIVILIAAPIIFLNSWTLEYIKAKAVKEPKPTWGEAWHYRVCWTYRYTMRSAAAEKSFDEFILAFPKSKNIPEATYYQAMTLSEMATGTGPTAYEAKDKAKLVLDAALEEGGCLSEGPFNEQAKRLRQRLQIGY